MGHYLLRRHPEGVETTLNTFQAATRAFHLLRGPQKEQRCGDGERE